MGRRSASPEQHGCQLVTTCPRYREGSDEQHRCGHRRPTGLLGTPTSPTALTAARAPTAAGATTAGLTQSPTAAPRRCSWRSVVRDRNVPSPRAGPDGRSSSSSPSGVGVLRRVCDAARVALLGVKRAVGRWLFPVGVPPRRFRSNYQIARPLVCLV